MVCDDQPLGAHWPLICHLQGNLDSRPSPVLPRVSGSDLWSDRWLSPFLQTVTWAAALTQQTHLPGPPCI